MDPEYSPQYAPQPEAPAPQRRWGRFGTKAALVAAGVVAGGVLASTLTATAATSSSTATPSTAASAAAGTCRGGGALSLSGTVTAVGTSSVTIKTSSGTTTYAVSSTSDIDKNGEASLSALKVGDAVRFNTSTVSGKVTIDKLHAGNEALDMPMHAPMAGATSGTTSG